MFDHYAAPLAAIAFVAATPVIAQQSPQAVLDELLATERSLSEAAANKRTGLKFFQRIKLLKTSFGNDRLTHWLHCLWRAVSR